MKVTTDVKNALDAAYVLCENERILEGVVLMSSNAEQ